jgi:AcrR family transcriptional regulator
MPVAQVRGSRRGEAIRAARKIVAAEGQEALTLRRLAADLGIQAPSLYKHFLDKAAVEAALADLAAQELDTLVASWAAERGADLAWIARGCRRFAAENPALYRLAMSRPRIGDPSTPLRELLGGEAAARAAWAFIHGLIAIETATGFGSGADAQAAWTAGLEAFARAARS